MSKIFEFSLLDQFFERATIKSPTLHTHSLTPSSHLQFSTMNTHLIIGHTIKRIDVDTCP